tara:strand:+ start:227 stop:331 length:105 start_codon:yes stop_codon:yes gene_type:complete
LEAVEVEVFTEEVEVVLDLLTAITLALVGEQVTL